MSEMRGGIFPFHFLYLSIRSILFLGLMLKFCFVLQGCIDTVHLAHHLHGVCISLSRSLASFLLELNTRTAIE